MYVGSCDVLFMMRKPCILLSLLPSERKVDRRDLHLLCLAKLRHCIHSFLSVEWLRWLASRVQGGITASNRFPPSFIVPSIQHS
jgi:hypothetical protein